MKIIKMLSSFGNDFTATMECENCGATGYLETGYNDNYYYNQVIPAMLCSCCGKNSHGITERIEGNTAGVQALKTSLKENQ